MATRKAGRITQAPVASSAGSKARGAVGKGTRGVKGSTKRSAATKIGTSTKRAGSGAGSGFAKKSPRKLRSSTKRSGGPVKRAVAPKSGVVGQTSGRPTTHAGGRTQKGGY